MFIDSAPARQTFETLLNELLALTESAWGFLGQVETAAAGTRPVPSLVADAHWAICHQLWSEAGDEQRGHPSSRQLFSGSFGRRLRGSPLLPDLFDRDGRLLT